MKPILLALSLLAAGCTVGPDYHPPALDAPGAWAGTGGPAAPEVSPTQPWWEGFHDPVLNGLVTRALAANPDVARAEAAVAEARAAVAAGASPTLTTGLSGSRGFGAGAVPVSFGFDSSWEVDLWGKKRRSQESARASADAAQANADDARLTLLGDLARNYVELRAAQTQDARIRASLGNRERQLAAVRTKALLGDGTALEPLQAAAALASAQAAVPTLDAAIKVSIHAISILCGAFPDALTPTLATPAPIPATPLPALGIPADLLRRRPDVRAAERQLAAAVAAIGVAEAGRYPTLSLSGNLTLSGGGIGSVLASPVFALGPSLDIPLFTAGARAAAVDVARARAEQARLAYRASVLNAYKEVEDALAQIEGARRARDRLAAALALGQRAIQVAQTGFRVGNGDFTPILDAQSALEATRDALSAAESTLATRTVGLYKAMGGGWSPRR